MPDTSADTLWFAMRDLKRPNALLPAWRQLGALGLHIFTPMQSVFDSRRRRSGERPVLPDLLFVRATRAELDPLVDLIPTLQYRYARGAQATPIIVPTAEMDRFIAAVTLLPNPRYYQPGEITPDMIGRTVHIAEGPLAGLDGRLLSVKGLRRRRLIVELPGLVTATVELSDTIIRL